MREVCHSKPHYQRTFDKFSWVFSLPNMSVPFTMALCSSSLFILFIMMVTSRAIVNSNPFSSINHVNMIFVQIQITFFSNEISSYKCWNVLQVGSSITPLTKSFNDAMTYLTQALLVKIIDCSRKIISKQMFHSRRTLWWSFYCYIAPCPTFSPILYMITVSKVDITL